jgi:hypothetical protein
METTFLSEVGKVGVEEKPKAKRGRPSSPAADVKLSEQFTRKHKVENVNKNQLEKVLDAYYVEGRTIIAMNISRDIGGTYEIVSYTQEPIEK